MMRSVNPLKAFEVWLRGPRVTGPMAPELPIQYTAGARAPQVAAVPLSDIKQRIGRAREPQVRRSSARERRSRSPRFRAGGSVDRLIRQPARSLARAHGSARWRRVCRNRCRSRPACMRPCATAFLEAASASRPALLFATARAVGLSEDEVEAAACAIELVHVYSLVHDDLPAMDDDDLRRGRPTCHKAYDEATALLVGDALQPLAFQLLARDPEAAGLARHPPALDRHAGASQRHLRHGRRPGHRSGGTGQAARHRAGRRHACAQNRRGHSRQRLDGGGMRAAAGSESVCRADAICQCRGSRVSDSGRSARCDRRCVDAGQGHGRRQRAREAHSPGGHRHPRITAARPVFCTARPSMRWRLLANARQLLRSLAHWLLSRQY